MTRTTESLQQLAARTAQDLRRGKLTLAQAAGLEPEELAALRDAVRALQQDGEHQAAAEMAGLLLACDPLNIDGWAVMEQLQQHEQAHELATACAELRRLLRHAAPRQQGGSHAL